MEDKYRKIIRELIELISDDKLLLQIIRYISSFMGMK
jgi:hypothetical protein